MLLLVVAVNLLSGEVKKVVSAEAGYVIHEKPKSMTALSLE